MGRLTSSSEGEGDKNSILKGEGEGGTIAHPAMPHTPSESNPGICTARRIHVQHVHVCKL